MTGQILAAALGLVGASACCGQDVWYLTPRSFHANPGEAIGLRVALDTGTGAEGPGELIFPSGAAERVFVRGGGKQWNLHHPDPIEPESVWSEVPMPEVGVAMIGLDCAPVIETVSSEDLRAFIAEHAPTFDEFAIPERDVRVRVVRCAKALVRIDDGRTEDWASPVAASKAGQRSEIRLGDDPTVAMIGSDVPVRLYADWRSRTGVEVMTSNVASGERAGLAVGDFGGANIAIDSAGVWRLGFHYLIDVDDGEADFELHSATLTYKVREGAER